MEFRGLETAVVDVLAAEELQRLRRIRQLGLVHLVFPAAEHSRLAHSIGAAHLAIRFARRIEEVTRDRLAEPLRISEEARRDVALAALCHDIGHGPLSHVWEREVIRHDFDAGAWRESLGLPDDEMLGGLGWHELVGQALLIWPDGDLHQRLETYEQGTSERIRRLLNRRHYLPYLPRLVDSDIDVDRCDFLLRDARLTGVAYGRYDINWLISTATIGVRELDNQLVFGFDRRKAPRVVEQLLVARRALYDTVYQHKTVRSAEAIVGLLLRRLRDVVENEGWVFQDDQLFAPYRAVLEGRPLAPRELLGLDDYSLWVLIMHVARSGEDVTARDIAERIVSRTLFKQVPVAKDRLEDFFVSRESYQRLEEAIAPHCPAGAEPRYYYHLDRDTFRTLMTGRDEEVYLVEQEGSESDVGRALAAHEHPELLPLMGPGESLMRLFVAEEAVAAATDLVARG